MVFWGRNRQYIYLCVQRRYNMCVFDSRAEIVSFRSSFFVTSGINTYVPTKCDFPITLVSYNCYRATCHFNLLQLVNSCFAPKPENLLRIPISIHLKNETSINNLLHLFRWRVLIFHKRLDTKKSIPVDIKNPNSTLQQRGAVKQM